MIKTCIIGVSGFGDVHYRDLMRESEAGRMEAVAAAIINQDEEAEKVAVLKEKGCKIFEDYIEMLNEFSGIADLCMIPTGTPLHRVMTEAALNAGMNVFVEKPAAGSIQDALAMQEAEKGSGKRVAVGYQHSYAPGVLPAKKAVLEGTIGKVDQMKCRILWPRKSSYYGRNGWAGKLKVGDTMVLDSPYNNAAAHYLMMMLFFAGASEREAADPVSVEAEIYRANEIESADTACIKVRTDTGMTLLFYVTHACSDLRHPEIMVRGSKGRVTWMNDKITIAPDTGAEKVIPTPSQGEVRKSMMDAVLGNINGENTFCCGLEMALKQTMVVHSVHEACMIHTVEGKVIEQEDGSTLTVIPGIEEDMEKAFAEEKLFHEVGIPWAQPSGSIECKTGDRPK